jgi:hypothetical protein
MIHRCIRTVVVLTVIELPSQELLDKGRLASSSASHHDDLEFANIRRRRRLWKVYRLK